MLRIAVLDGFERDKVTPKFDTVTVLLVIAGLKFPEMSVAIPLVILNPNVPVPVQPETEINL